MQAGGGLPGPPPGMVPQSAGFGPPRGWPAPGQAPPQQQQAPPPAMQQLPRPPPMMGAPPSQGMLPQHAQMPAQPLGGGPPDGMPFPGMPPAQQVTTLLCVMRGCPSCTVMSCTLPVCNG